MQKVAISKHLKNIFASGELIEDSVVFVLETTEGSLTEKDIEYFKNVSVPKLYVHKEKREEYSLPYNAYLNPLEIRLAEIDFNH